MRVDRDVESTGGSSGAAAELLSGEMEAAGVVPCMSTGFTDPRFFRSTGIPMHVRMPVLLPRDRHGKIHGVGERIPADGIEGMTEVMHGLTERWNAWDGLLRRAHSVRGPSTQIESILTNHTSTGDDMHGSCPPKGFFRPVGHWPGRVEQAAGVLMCTVPAALMAAGDIPAGPGRNRKGRPTR